MYQHINVVAKIAQSGRISHRREGSAALRDAPRDACLRGKDTPRRDDIRVLSSASRSSLVPRVELPGLQRCPTPGTGDRAPGSGASCAASLSSRDVCRARGSRATSW
ncbi:hypothetical protein EYF80_057363 [Liparis tanakae]|uniref:Uncharacterized protein n=1 Tax=Liparis tanakae TaxID=230148 RepID=A0A4Z2EU73_9TELE|nr:hypothetical protein EYF80_057363 [Liparis tanakae]